MLLTALTVFGGNDVPSVVLDLPPSGTNCRNSEGDFVRLKDGRILFVYSHFTKGTGADGDPAYLASRESTDGGRTWTMNSLTAVANEAGQNVMSVSLLRLKNGAIALFYCVKNSGSDCRPVMRLSTDEAKTWGPPILCVGEADKAYYVLNNCRVLELANGRLVLPLCKHEKMKDGKTDWNGKLVCYLSDDSGRTWRRNRAEPFATFDAKGKRVLTQEPGLIALKDGRVLMYARTNRGLQWACTSSDNCENWTTCEPWTLWGPCSPATVKRLRNGDLLAVWNDHENRPDLHKQDVASGWGNRVPMTLAVSKDDGLTWPIRKTLADDPKGCYCYTAVLELEDRLLLGYCALQSLRETHVTSVPLDWLYAPAADAVTLDFSQTIGPVKPINGVGQPPMVGALGGWDLMHYFKEAGIPYSRLHDVGGWLGGGLYADIPNLFPDFDADENDPKNYRFIYTDELMKAVVGNGVEPFFRLGVTIENWVERGLPPLRCMPPKDFAKWARICEHVIRHYTEGWANGYKYRISYWEIWNEPDNMPDLTRNPCWYAPFDEYLKFYGTVAPYLKGKFPHLKIGGYGSCGFYAGVGAKHVAAANSSPRMSYFIDCAHAFLRAARENKWPLDFFSYHSYSDTAEALRQVHFADSLLNSYGFTREKTERVYNEWLPSPSQKSLGTTMQAAKIAAELCGLQNGPCDLACLYDGRCGVGSYSPLFNPMTLKPHKAYYVYRMFNELRKLGKSVRAPATPAGVYATAATDGGTNAAVMVANISGKPWRTSGLDFGDWTIAETRVIDERRTCDVAAWPVEIPDNTTWLLKLKKANVHSSPSPSTFTSTSWLGFSRGMGFGGWLTNYKRFNVLPEDKRLLITEGDLEHFETYLTEADVARVASWGFDHVRVGFDQIVLEEKPGVWRERTFRKLDDFVGWCGKHGLNVVLNLHKAIGNYCDIKEKRDLLDDPELQARFIALWLEIERRYHAKPNLAFEILNEVRDVDPAKWNDLADRTVRALRVVNPNRWIVVGPTCWNNPPALAKLKVWDDPKVVYTFHMYAPFQFTHQRGVLQPGTLVHNRAIRYPSPGYDRAVLEREMKGAFDFAKAHPDKILWNGEFGTIRHADPASRVAYMRDVVTLCREHGIPWCVWNYLSTPNDGNRFSLVDDDTREFLSDDLLSACLGLSQENEKGK